jgi:hypothetical protein
MHLGWKMVGDHYLKRYMVKVPTSVDVASYEKELASGSPSANLVAILLRHGNEGDVFDSAMAAKDHVRQKIADIEGRLHHCLEEALKDSEGRSDDSRRWLRALPYIVSGNTWWGQLVSLFPVSSTSQTYPKADEAV